MKIVVCVKHVPDGRLRLDPASGRLERSGAGELNGFDTNAVEEALRVREAVGGEVVAVSMGPDGAADSLRTALGLGADRAVLVSDAGAVGSDLVATSAVLAKALGREAADLVLFGQQTDDGGGAMLWAAVGERLRQPIASQVTELTVDGAIARVVRQTEFGDDVIELTLPALVAVSDAINEPRYASLKGMMGAKRKPLEVLSLADLAVERDEAGEAGSRTEVRAVGAPPRRADAERVEDGGEGEAAQAILDFLVARSLA